MKIDLRELSKVGRPGISRSEGGHLAEAASVAAEHVGQPLPRQFYVSGRKKRKPHVHGPRVSNRTRRTYADIQEAIEWGASGIAALAIESLEGLTVYERSPKSGHGFDYFLIPHEPKESDGWDDDNFFAQATHVLEVSGTAQDDENVLFSRTREKLERLKARPRGLPAFVLVVDFRFCRARLAKYG